MWCFFSVDGCLRDQCRYKHPNGKSEREAKFKRDATPMGERPVLKNGTIDMTKSRSNADAVVAEYPKAMAAHARNQARRVRMQIESD